MNGDFDRDRLPAEQLLNTLSSALGLLIFLVGLPLLLVLAVRHGNVWHVVSAAVYGTTLVLGYTAFTLYHIFKNGDHHTLFKIFDHAAIYLLIAGTYTPFTLVNLRGHGGWLLFGVMWALAGAGVVFKTLFIHRFRIVSPILYVVMGWLIVVAIKPAMSLIPAGGLELLVAGGLFYTGGLVFYGIGKIPYHHALWHLFVIAGSLCHFLAVILHVIPS